MADDKKSADRKGGDSLKHRYDESKIKTLSSLEHIRLRTGMYIGRIGDGSHYDDGGYILLKEVIDNAIDEFIMGHGKEVHIQIEGGRVRVRDFGRGIPLGKVIDCVSKINTGAKYNDDVFQFSVGLNGVGTKAVNALQQGLFEEEANQNLEAAIPHYQRAVARIEDQRRLAATAVFRLGECFRKLGRTNEAAAQYERLLRDFPDQTNLMALGRQQLRGWGMASVALPALLPGQTQGGLSPAGRAKLRELVASEIEIAKQLLAEQRKLLKSGCNPSESPIGSSGTFSASSGNCSPSMGLPRHPRSRSGAICCSRKSPWRKKPCARKTICARPACPAPAKKPASSATCWRSDANWSRSTNRTDFPVAGRGHETQFHRTTL
jgi:hypothetical protein